jgi:serine phosphatase RsbU (regulator of sigma subunit)
VLVLMLELKDKLVARDEIDVAREVQLNLLPREHPVIGGWEVWSSTRPANDVGGDLVDYLHEHGEIGVVLGDVAGKGMGAALLMAKLQATLRALATDHADLADLARRLNEILHRDGLDNRFATFFYASIRPGAGRLRWVNAGHNPPLLLRAGGAVEELPASGLPLGVLPGISYTESRVELDSGDLLAIYSDGLSEAADGEEEEYGPERLAALLPGLAALSLEQAGAAILADVDRFTGNRRLQDDLSLVLLRRMA